MHKSGKERDQRHSADESKAFKKAGEIILTACRKILEKETPSLDDVRYLFEELNKAAGVFVREYQLPQFSDDKRRYEKILQAWNKDRSLAFIRLLRLYEESKKDGRVENAEAYYRCVIVLIGHALFSEIRDERFLELYQDSQVAFALAQKYGDLESFNLLQANLLGIQYNMQLFSPHLFSDSDPSSNSSELLKKLFLESLSLLGGGSLSVLQH